MRLFCFGYGYSAEALVRKLSPRLTSAAGTRTGLADAPVPAVTLATYTGDAPSAEVRRLLEGSTHVLVSIPPDLEGDAVLRHFAEDLATLPDLTWIGYLSTIGVYGDCKGAWVDEAAPVSPTSERSLRRAQAERAWMEFGEEAGRRVDIFRLAGIYGPGRSVIDNLHKGTARRIVKPGQVFNRIHVDDIARVLSAAVDAQTEHRVFNVSDDEPAPPEDVVAYAAELLGLPVPPAVPFAEAGLTGLAASFWGESKRVRNGRIRGDLGVDLVYPTYREGLRALAG
jgi:NAD dependent epimerase/dehydratase family enzyme